MIGDIPAKTQSPELSVSRILEPIGIGLLAALSILLVVPEIAALWPSWHNDTGVSHGPIVAPIALGLLWMQRNDLKTWKSASVRGLIALVACILVYVAAVWADIEFLKPLAQIGMVAAGIWFLGGIRNLVASIGAIGLLVFMIPWPTTLVDRLSFPLQLTSSSYAALFAGLLGVPIHREGVQLYVLPNPDAKPIYSIVVAQKCSGLTSLVVLLFLGYLTAYITPLKTRWRLLMVASVVPLALFANALRLTIILFAGAHGSAGLAQWIHDHETPVLILFCSTSLVGLRHLLLIWQNPESKEPEPAV